MLSQRMISGSGVDVRYIELDNEVSNQNDGYQCWNPYINVTVKEMKEAENAAYDNVKATYPDVMVSSTTFSFPGLSCVPEGQGPDCEIDKERRNSFVKAYFEDSPKPKFDFLVIHETMGGSGSSWTTSDKPSNATYEYNFGSYYDAYDMWREILDKYSYADISIFNLKSGAVRAGKQDIDLLQKVIFARTQAEKNKIIGWVVVQLLESEFTASKSGAGITLISFQLPVNGDVALKIYNMLGQEVCTLINKNKPTGYHSVVWNGTDNSGRKVSSGLLLK